MKNCKYCGRELEDGQSVCPGCGREWTPEEAPVPEETLPVAEEAVEEASMVLSLCEGYRVEYPIFIDSEGAGGNGRADGLDISTRTEVCRAFCETIEGAGYSSGVYASRNWLNKNLSLAQLENYMTWLAEYRETPQYGGRYQFWQYTSSGSVDGIKGRVDLDISYLAY